MTETREPRKVADIMPLTALTLNAIQAEALRAHCLHGEHSILSKEMPDCERLAILVQEIVDVAHVLNCEGDKTKLEIELIRLAAVAATWIEALTTR
jgi:hypothetical protein